MKRDCIWDTVRDELGSGTGKAVLVGAILIPILVIIVLLVPPISVLPRLTGDGGAGGQITLGANGGSTSLAGLTLEIRPGALASDVSLKVQRDSKGQIAQSLPQDVAAASAVYALTPSASVDAPLSVGLALDEPAGKGDNLDIFALEGDTWNWVSAAALSEDGRTARAVLKSIPSALVVGKIPAQRPSIAGWLAPRAGMDPVARETLDVVSPLWHVANDDGSLTGPLTPLPAGKFVVYPTIQNFSAGTFKGEIVNRIIRSDDIRKRHVANIVAVVKANSYAGIDINYQGVDPLLRDQFTAFVTDLAASLHQERRRLSLVLPLPDKGAGGWQTGAYDWYALGRAADYVVVAAERDQSVYPSVMPEVLSYATSQIDRRKLHLMVSVLSHEKSKAGLRDLALAEALDLVSKVEVKGNARPLPGETITLFAPNLLRDSGASGLAWSNETKTVTFSYQAADGQRTVWLENSFSLAYKLEYVKRFNLRGFSVQNLGDSAADRAVSVLLQQFKTTGSVEAVAPSEGSLSVVWRSSDGSIATSGSGWTNWTAPNRPGATYTMSLTVGDGTTAVTGTKALAVAIPPTPTSTPTPQRTATPTPTVTAPARATSQPTATPPQPTAVPATPTPLRVVSPGGARYPGVSYGMQIDVGNDPPRALRLLQGAGFSWAKVQIRWEDLERSRGNIDWGLIDQVVNQMAASGTRLLFSVVTAPKWSTPADYTEPGPPSDPRDFANFVSAIASRHPGKVHAYEIWNEQNVYHEWGGKGRRISAGKYLELLREAYNAIKRADPNAVVVSGGLTPTGFNDGDTAYDDVVYMDMMYQAGLKDYSDAIGVHGNVVMPYAADLLAGANGDHGSFYFRRFDELRAIMERYGDDGKQIWFTEFGWPSSAENLWRFPRAVQISEGQQAEWLVQAFQVAKARGYVGGMFLWNLNFGPSADAADEWGKAAFSVLRRDWSPRPAYNALAAMAK